MAQATTEKHTMTGGKAVVEALKAEGVDTVFGIISIHMLPVYDALRADPDIRLIIPRHEMAGGFMADAYARVTGKPGVFLTSTGPGAANSMGAVIEAWYYSSPTIQLTGQIESNVIDQLRHSLHEVPDQCGMFNASGAHAVRAARTEEIAPAIHQAFQRLRGRRPQPQVVEIPIDQQYRQAETAIAPLQPLPAPEVQEGRDAEAVELLANATQPVIWAGGGVVAAGAETELLRLAEKLSAPVFTTRSARGALSEDHPLCIGNFFGERPARAYLESADVVLAVGTKFSWHTTRQFALKLTPNLIRIDIDPAMLERSYPPAVELHDDARIALARINDLLDQQGAAPDPGREQQAAKLKSDLREGFRKYKPITADLMDRIDRAAPRDRIVVTDSTLPATWGANQYLPIRQSRSFMTAGLAAIGPGYPMALGAQAAAPDRPVLCIAGDGGFVMHMAELATAVQENLPVVLMIFNNRSYGVLKMLQRNLMDGRTFACDLHTPDFVKVAEACGMAAEAARTPDELEAAVRRAFDARAPYLIDVQTEFEG